VEHQLPATVDQDVRRIVGGPVVEQQAVSNRWVAPTVITASALPGQ
jgi:hypothetical protein